MATVGLHRLLRVSGSIALVLLDAVLRGLLIWYRNVEELAECQERLLDELQILTLSGTSESKLYCLLLPPRRLLLIAFYPSYLGN